MDELLAFKEAPAALKAADRRLLGQAELVFTGGASLYRARQPYSDNIHLFPSGVDIQHFARADRERFAKPTDIAHLQPPLLGYFGVIDERMDLDLLAPVAAHKPVVSTPIPDMIELYGAHVRIGETPEEFVTQIEAALAATAEEQFIRRQREQELLTRYTWDNIAERMGDLIATAYQEKATQVKRMQPLTIA